MLTESKITLTVAAAGGNATLGVSINEFLKMYLLNIETSEETKTIDNTSIELIAPTRKKPKAFKLKGEKTSFDPRSSKNTINSKISDSTYTTHTLWDLRRVKAHRNKLANWKENENWWKSIYKQRMYMLENQDIFRDGVRFKEGFDKSIIWDLKQEVYINQFCYKVYGSAWHYDKYTDLFWLICSEDGKRPSEKREAAKIISTAEKAKFPTDNNQEQEIEFMTLSQAKKKQADKDKFKVNKDKFVVYDYSEEWWKWSYQYRLQKDKTNENSAFPLSDKFKNITVNWDEKLTNDNSLNKVCKDFYESSSNSDNETEDAWRYCSIEGEKNN
ncbi:hypothetical protein MHSWG343_06150 [Candidatus Mycoplasma haematohominis]|uniref:Uncharacterized protein n=1 Tax=Candidatus Mycoplasma haematohominis TaxID=1494318 RepID=A0A478FQ13_9MOLU|nr:hypothetical protein MHSWG343_06150 [Candidatus Mycoplasma haemohominis]